MTSTISRAAELLRAGKLVAIPTETVYGLAANALDESAVRRIFEAKGTPVFEPVDRPCRGSDDGPRTGARMASAGGRAGCPILAGSTDHHRAEERQSARSRDGRVARRRFANARASCRARCYSGCAGFRWPRPAPIASRSYLPRPRNTFAKAWEMRSTSFSMAAHARWELKARLYRSPGPVPRILRPGMISQTQIEEVIGPVEAGAGAESPGQHPKHYSPRTRVVVGDSPSEGRGARLDTTNMPRASEAYAEQFYAKLHELDQQGYDWIAIELPPDKPEWAGIRDRILRSAKSM